MSRKRKPGRPRGSSNKKNNEPNENIFSNISQDVLREIGAITLFILSFILMVSIFGFGGSLGETLNNYSRTAIGWTTFLLPILLGGTGYALFFPEKFKIGVVSSSGIGLIILSFCGIFQIFMSQSNAQKTIDSGDGGGYIGTFIQSFFLSIFNAPVSFIVLLAFVVVGILLAGNTSLRSLFGKNELAEESDTEKGDIKIHESVPISKNAQFEKKQQREDRQDLPIMSVGDDSMWKFPPLSIFEEMTTRADSGNVKEKAALIQKTFSNFSIGVSMSDVNIGPTVTQYTLRPDEGVKLEKLTALDKNISLALASHPIRIEAPIPGKSLVGIEVPNKSSQIVRMRNLLASETFKNRKSKLSVVLGLDVAGHPQIADITKMPHMLIAGATGSGKSVCINTVLLSLLYQNTPKELKLILVDPKRVELSLYNNIPHLLTPVIVDQDKTVSALKWAVAEMERRYNILQQAGKRNISEYNSVKGKDSMPYIVIIIDELADLMAVSANDVEGLICRLAQMARAVGLHLIIATQRPSVDVITGLIKANIPTRIAFSVASQVDSRTILDQAGAEKLLGMGDMLFLSAELSKPRRIQGAYVSEKEVSAITEFLKNQETPEYNEEILLQANRAGMSGEMGEVNDDLFYDAAECVIRAGKASASLLQRRLRIGYARAARLLDFLEERGVVGPQDGARPRDVIIDDMTEIRDRNTKEGL